MIYETPAFARLEQWHRTIEKDGITIADRIRLYNDELQELSEAETFGSKIKEAVDCIVTAYAVAIYSGDVMLSDTFFMIVESHYESIRVQNVSPDDALAKVNESNFSKLILPGEIKDTVSHFKSEGIDVDIIGLSKQYYGAFSKYDQTVNGKDYPKNKLLKPPHYAAVDEGKDWWRL